MGAANNRAAAAVGVDDAVVAGVRQLPAAKLGHDPLAARYLSMLQRWIRFADTTYQVWDDRPQPREECGHFFGGSYWYANDTANPVAVYGIAARSPHYDADITGLSRDHLVARALAALRFLAYTHDTGPEGLVRPEGRNPHASGKKWGGAVDGFFRGTIHAVPTTALGIGAWALWDDLDDELRLRVATIVAGYAQRWGVEEPRVGTYYNTQMEENAWTGMGIGFAHCLLADHPDAGRWREAAQRWIINSRTVPADRYEQRSIGGKPVRDWVTTTTIHPDFTAENHGFVHPDYMAAGVTLPGRYALWHLLAGESVPEVAGYNVGELYGVLQLLRDWDGEGHFIQGQDWWYTRYATVSLDHAVMNVLFEDREAAALERQTLALCEAVQAAHPSGALLAEDGQRYRITAFQTAWSFEPQTACHGVLACYLLHAAGGAGVEPAPAQQIEQSRDGVHVFPHGGFVIHRGSTDSGAGAGGPPAGNAAASAGAHQRQRFFASSAWRNVAMNLTIPARGKWDVTALPHSSLGQFSVRGVAADRPRVVRHQLDVRGDGFSTTAQVERLGGAVRQLASFTSLANGCTVLLTMVDALSGVAALEARIGMVGVRNESYPTLAELAPGKRVVHGAQGRLEAAGYLGGDDELHPIGDTTWLNLDDRIGYLMPDTAGVLYVGKHDYPKWKGLEDILVLDHRRADQVTAGSAIARSRIVTYPNQHHHQTARAAQRLASPEVSPAHVGAEAVLALGVDSTLVVASFAGAPQVVVLTLQPAVTGPTPLYRGTQQLTGGGGGGGGGGGAPAQSALTVELPAFSTQVVPPVAWIGAPPAGARLTVDALGADRLLVTNHGAGPVPVQLHRQLTGGSRTAATTHTVAAGATVPLGGQQ